MKRRVESNEDNACENDKMIGIMKNVTPQKGLAFLGTPAHKI